MCMQGCKERGGNKSSRVKLKTKQPNIKTRREREREKCDSVVGKAAVKGERKKAEMK